MRSERVVNAYLRDKQKQIKELEDENTELNLRERHFKEVMIATLKIEINLLRHILEEK
ncbi:hypothetical protein [Tissierella sp.]|uniref:hypothetical protein n=1 Tax=Tissierella sp. TaxID=41274 RepID=UPI0028649C60|nr:hypothetical protein [Tissierella sp.]MDR7856334.1 hypothetical protein [Tissierella sp.]